MSQLRRAVIVACLAVASLAPAGCAKPTAPAALKVSSTPAAPATTTTAAPAPTTPTGPDVGELLDKSEATAKKFTSVRIKGTMKDDGTPVALDLKTTADGAALDVSGTLGADKSFRIIKVGGRVYLKASRTFLTDEAGAAAGRAFANRWLRLPKDDKALSGLAEAMDAHKLLDAIYRDTSAASFSDEVDEATVNGVNVWVLTDADGPDEGRLYLAKDTYLPMRMAGGGDKVGQFDFTLWNTNLGIKAPPRSAVTVV